MLTMVLTIKVGFFLSFWKTYLHCLTSKSAAFMQTFTSAPNYLSPSCRQTTSASLSSHWSSHMEPHCPAWKTSTVPSVCVRPPTSLTGSGKTTENRPAKWGNSMQHRKHTSSENLDSCILTMERLLIKIRFRIHKKHAKEGVTTLLLCTSDGCNQSTAWNGVPSVPGDFWTLEQIWLISFAVNRTPVYFGVQRSKQRNCPCVTWHSGKLHWVSLVSIT